MHLGGSHLWRASLVGDMCLFYRLPSPHYGSEPKFTLYLRCSKRAYVCSILAELQWRSEILPVIRVEMKDLVYIQVILNGTWQSRGAKASPASPLHINKYTLL